VSRVIAIAGKGGTGKTTIAALLIRCLLKNGKRPVLAVDADPDTNLPAAIGMSAEKTLATIGGTREDFFANRDQVPAGMPKEAWLEMQLAQALVESRDIDLMVMGRPEGPGCYCYINNMLRKYLESLGKNYPFVVIDNEAGLEHLSRRTAQAIETLMLVSDYSLNGLRAAERVRDLAREMKLQVGRVLLVVNRAPQELSAQFASALAAAGIELAGRVPLDPLLPEFEIAARPVMELPDDSAAVIAMETIAARVLTP
jgi:CO dehydrogenase maturation factor